MPVEYFYKKDEGLFDYKERCYPNLSDIRVFRYRDEPPSYEIRAEFEGVRDLLEELKAPSHVNRIYCLRIYDGAMFIPKADRSHKRFINYTVEQFGLLMVPELKERGGFETGYTSLKASNYLCVPIYWNERPDYRVQVWRTRVFNCPRANFLTSISNPFGPSRPFCMYLEERWHPNIGKQRSLTWVEHRSREGKEIDQFRKDALLILGEPRRAGRKRAYTDPGRFIQDLKEAYEEIAHSGINDPTQHQVAFALGIASMTLKRYLDRYGIPWPPREIFASVRNPDTFNY